MSTEPRVKPVDVLPVVPRHIVLRCDRVVEHGRLGRDGGASVVLGPLLKEAPPVGGLPEGSYLGDFYQVV